MDPGLTLSYRMRCIAGTDGHAAEYVVFLYKDGTYGVVGGGRTERAATLVAVN